MPNSLSRQDNHRQSLLRNLATSLVLYEEIKTTSAKAREVKPLVERIISKAKKDKSKNFLTARRLGLKTFFDEKATRKLFEIIVPRFSKMESGFIGIYKLGRRKGDNADMVLMKLAPGEPVEIKPQVGVDVKEKKEKNAPKSKSTVNRAESAKTVTKKK